MKTSIPLILVHTGDSFYLEPVLRQAREFNHNNLIYLISDASTNHYEIVEHVNIDDYFTSATKLEPVYNHMSINPYNYELFCLQRWFVILDFVTKNNISHFLCIDSDVLLYCSVDDVFDKWLDYDYTLCNTDGPQYTLFNQESLKKFCNYIFTHYNNKEAIEEVRKWHKYGSVSDMTFLTHYSQLPEVCVFNTAQVVDGACFELNMKIPQGYEMQGRLKKIYWKDGLPYGKEVATGNLIRFNALHFQGGVKHKLNQYIYRDLPLLQRCWKNILWVFNPKRLKSRVNELKKIFGDKQMFVYFIQKRILWRNENEQSK